jgi:ADP-ribosylation factor-like protein 5B
VLIFANKQDKKGSLTATEITNALNLHKIKSHEWHIQACCALTGNGLMKGMDWIVSKLKK